LEPDPDGEAAQSDMPPHPGDALHEATLQFARFREFASYYIATRFDAIKLTIRRLGIAAGMMIVAGVGAMAVITTAVVLLMQGIAGGLAELFPRYPWLGDIITGVIFLIVLIIAIMIGMRAVTRTFKSLTVHKYEARQRQQRQHFGSDVRDNATRSAGPSGKAQ
jgi:membrane protein implicated in regulation of membrane protease activity